jgi:hypothetical protein
MQPVAMITPANIGPSLHDKANRTSTDPVASRRALRPLSLLQLLKKKFLSDCKSLLSIVVSSVGLCLSKNSIRCIKSTRKASLLKVDCTVSPTAQALVIYTLERIGSNTYSATIPSINLLYSEKGCFITRVSNNNPDRTGLVKLLATQHTRDTAAMITDFFCCKIRDKMYLLSSGLRFLVSGVSELELQHQIVLTYAKFTRPTRDWNRYLEHMIALF